MGFHGLKLKRIMINKMKKLPVMLFMSFFSLGICSQEIEIDHVNSNDVRTITTTEMSYNNLLHQENALFWLKSVSSENENMYYLNFRFKYSELGDIKKGDKLLLKTTNKKVIELNADKVWKDTVYLSPNSKGFTIQSCASYQVSKTQLDLICKGITKLRLEKIPKNYERDFSSNIFSQLVSDDLNLIKEALKQKKSFYDGFSK